MPVTALLGLLGDRIEFLLHTPPKAVRACSGCGHYITFQAGMEQDFTDETEKIEAEGRDGAPAKSEFGA
jgi:hypothetical protein